MAKEQRNLATRSFKEQTTSIQVALNEFRNNLEGYIWAGDGKKYSYTGEPLAGTSVINALVGLLSSFCFDSNLITVKDYPTFLKQQLYVCKQANRILHINPYSVPENHPQIFQMFDDTLQNIGDIVLGSKALIREVLKGDDEEKVRNF